MIDNLDLLGIIGTIIAVIIGGLITIFLIAAIPFFIVSTVIISVNDYTIHNNQHEHNIAHEHKDLEKKTK